MQRLSPRSAAHLAEVLGWPLLGLAAASRLGRSGQPWLLDLVDTFHPVLAGLWVPLGLLAVRTRSPRLALLAALGAALVANHAQIAVGRGRRPCASARPRLRVLTANVLARNPSAIGLAELIERERPDIVALQEVRADFWAELIARVGDRLPYGCIEPHERFSGAAILCRRPLARAETFQLARRGHFCQRAEVDLDGRRLHLFNIHLQTNFVICTRRNHLLPFGVRRCAASARDEQLDELLGLLGPLDGPTLVLGDFNAAAGSRPHRQLLRHLGDAFRDVGRGPGHTYPQPGSLPGPRLPPLLRIDYVFFKGPLAPRSARTLPHPGSDHRAVLVELDLAASR